MKIIHIIDAFEIGGVNSFVYDLCIELKDAGQDVTLIGLIEGDDNWKNCAKSVIDAGIPVYCLGLSNKKQAMLKGIPKLRKAIKEIAGEENTICNLHLKLSVLLGGLATIGIKSIKCVETYHNSYHHYLLEYFMMQSRIKKYITVSETAKKEMRERFRVREDKVIAIPNGISRERIRKKVKKIGHEGDYISILSVGRLSYEKNFIIPVKAFSTVCNEKIRYTIVGDGPQRKMLEDEAARNAYVKFTGAISRQKVLNELALADIVVMPSLWEGRSILQLEAMAFDLPMILSDVPGLRETFGIENSDFEQNFKICEFGYLVKTNDTSSYIEALEHYINNNIEQKNTMKKYIEKKSMEQDIKQTARKYIIVYENVIDKT